MKYPSCILNGKYASGNCISIAVAKENQIQDTGAKMIHLAPNTKSNITLAKIGEIKYSLYFFIIFFILNSIPFSLRSKAHIGMKALSLKRFHYIIYLKGIYTTKHGRRSCRLL